MFVNDGDCQLGGTAEGPPSLGLLPRFAFNSVRWFKLNVFFRILAVFFISTRFELIKKRDVSWLCSTLRDDERKGDRLFFSVGNPESTS